MTSYLVMVLKEWKKKKENKKKVGSQIFSMGMMGTDHNNRMTKRH